MKNIAIIPARGGSKRLPGKNILPFMGKPIIFYSIEAAKKSALFDKIIVSTDDEKVIECVKEKCEVVKREKKLASDTARVVDVLKDLLNSLKKREETFDNLCCLYATSPLRREKDIIQSFNLMEESRADFCQSVTEYEFSPFFAFDMGKEGFIKRRWWEIAVLPHWEKPEVVVGNGSIYWARVEAFLSTGELEGEKTVGYKMSRSRSVDIDTMTDFKLAHFFAEQRRLL